MKNKKGFTLVELLAVVAILAILAGIATPIVLTVQKKIKNKMYIAKEKMITEAAILCAERIGKEDSCNTVNNLCTSGFLSTDDNCNGVVCSCQKNPVSGSSMDDCGITLNANETTTKRWTATLQKNHSDCKGLD